MGEYSRDKMLNETDDDRKLVAGYDTLGGFESIGIDAQNLDVFFSYSRDLG